MNALTRFASRAARPVSGTRAARIAALAAVAVAAFAGASSAQARDNVQFSLSVGTPGVYVQPAPVYVPAPVYTRPAPVYVQPAPVYVRPAPVYGPVYAPGYYGWHHPHHGRDWRRGPNGDFDRDGVPNRYDRFPSNPHYR